MNEELHWGETGVCRCPGWGVSPPQHQNPSNGLLWHLTSGWWVRGQWQAPAFLTFGSLHSRCPSTGVRCEPRAPWIQWGDPREEELGHCKHRVHRERGAKVRFSLWWSLAGLMSRGNGAQNSAFVPCGRCCERLSWSSPQATVPTRLSKWTKSQSSPTFSSAASSPSLVCRIFLRDKNSRSEISMCARRRCSLGRCGHWVRNEQSWCVLFNTTTGSDLQLPLTPYLPYTSNTGWELENSKSALVYSCSLNLAFPGF